MEPAEIAELQLLMRRAIRAAARKLAQVKASCYGKWSFDSAEDARRAMQHRGTMPYHCTHCRKWHVGTTFGQKRRLSNSRGATP